MQVLSFAKRKFNFEQEEMEKKDYLNFASTQRHY